MQQKAQERQREPEHVISSSCDMWRRARSCTCPGLRGDLKPLVVKLHSSQTALKEVKGTEEWGGALVAFIIGGVLVCVCVCGGGEAGWRCDG